MNTDTITRSRPLGAFIAVALIAALVASVPGGAVAGNGEGNRAHAAKKKKCKKKGKKSAAAAKKKACKKKKKKGPAQNPSPTTPAPQTPIETLRASLAWTTPDEEFVDFDLYVWDEFGNNASYFDNGIPNSRNTGQVDGGPEQFFDRLNPSTREFTYGVCLYDDGDFENDVERNYTLTTPLDGAPTVSSLTGSGDFVVYGEGTPLGGWCEDADED